MPGFDLLCLPSESEGFPNVVAEAMSCGVAALVTDVGDAAIIVGMSEMVVPPFQPQALAGNISRYFRASLDERVNLSGQVRDMVCSQFSVNSAWHNYCKIYNELIEY